MPELGDDGHLALELLDNPGIGLGAGEHDFHRHFSPAMAGAGQIDSPAAAATEFALDVVALELEHRLVGLAEDHAIHGFGRKAGEVALGQCGVDLPCSVAIFDDPHFDPGLANLDLVAVFQVDVRVGAFGSLLGCLAFFASADFFPVDVGAIHAAEVAQGGLRRAGFEQEMVTRDLRVVGQAEVAVLHPPEQEGIVLGEVEDPGGAIGVAGVEVDGGHGKKC